MNKEIDLFPDAEPLYIKGIINCKLSHSMSKTIHKDRPSDLGYDVFCIPDDLWVKDSKGLDCFTLDSGASHLFKTGLHVQAKDSRGNLMGFLFRDRSSMAKRNITCLGGVIDPEYTGEWMVKLINLGPEKYVFYSGDKIVQAIIQNPAPNYDINVVNSLKETNRGEKAFGSSGR